MGVIIIFSLIAILAAFATISAIRNKNILGFLFGAATLLVFGFFSIASIIYLPESIPAKNLNFIGLFF